MENARKLSNDAGLDRWLLKVMQPKPKEKRKPISGDFYPWIEVLDYYSQKWCEYVVKPVVMATDSILL